MALDRTLLPSSLRCLAFFAVAILSGCTTVTDPPKARLERVVILATNDVHGGLVPQTRNTADEAPVSYETGGAVNLAGYVNALREEFGSELVWLDGGDEFQGTLESNVVEGASVVRFFNHAGLIAAAVGNHEFDFGPVGEDDSRGDLRGALKSRMREARYTFLSANTVEKSTGKSPFPDAPPSILIPAGKVKLGVIGLTTTRTPFATRPEFVRDLEFTDLGVATQREAARLRQAGAEIILIVAHVGANCGNEAEPTRTWSPDTPQNNCDPGTELSRLLLALPPGTIDAVVSGHLHEFVHNWIAGVPVVQTNAGGRYFNLLYLWYDPVRKRIDPAATRIEGPVAVCGSVFEAQGDCDGSRPAPDGGRGGMVAPSIHGKRVRPDPGVVALLEPVIARVAAIKNRVVGNAARPVTRYPEGESELGNLVTDAIRERAKTDFALVNAYGIRTGIDAGPITYGEVYAALPFDNYIVTLELTGAELKRIIRVAESGAVGYFPLSGLRARLISKKTRLVPDDWNGDGKREQWEADRLTALTTTSGQPIRDEERYTLALPDFLVQGGDRMDWVMSQIPRERITESPGVTLRDTVAEAITRMESVNPPEKPLMDPANPRLIFE